MSLSIPAVSVIPGYMGVSFITGDTATVVATVASIQSTAGTSHKTASKAATTVKHGHHLLVRSAPVNVDGLDWLEIQSEANHTPIHGWVAIADPQGMRLLAPTAIATALQIQRPMAERWALSQGWGAWPDLYRQITYDRVPLKGHNGLDFAAPVGTPVVAVDAGVIKRVDFEIGGFGNFILIEHTWGESLYAHLAQVAVRPKTPVTAGQSIALSGKTGRCYGAHLHFGIRIFPYRRTDGWGGFCDPTPFLHAATEVVPRATIIQRNQMVLELAGYQRP